MEVRKKNIFGNLSEETISSFEKKNGIKLPDDYRRFLLSYNTCEVFPQDFWDVTGEDGGKLYGPFYGLHNGPDYCRLDIVNSWYNDVFNKKYLAIASDFQDNQLCINLNNHRIHFWIHDENVLLDIAANFDAFLESLVRDTQWADDDLEDKLFYDIEDDLPNEVEKHFNDWLTIDYRFEESGWSLLQACVVDCAVETAKLLITKGAVVEKAIVDHAQKNLIDDSDDYDKEAIYSLLKGYFDRKNELS